jgi:hypothetical protein
MRIITTKEDLKGKSLTALGMRKQKKVPVPDSFIFRGDRENMDLLEECRRYWESLRDFRDRRLRNRKYYRGDQWSDMIKDPDSDDFITEETYLMNQGKVPLKQNQIRQLVKNLIGQYRSNPSKSLVISRGREQASETEMLTNALQCALENNTVKELDAREFEEFAISGAPWQKVGYKYWKERNLEDLYIENVNVTRLFFNTDVSDIRLTDMRLVGEIIDTTVDDIVSTFSKSPADEKRIREIYAGMVTKDYIADQGLSADRIDNLDFYIPTDPNKARLYEIWKLRGEWRTYAHDPLDGSYNIVPYTIKEIAAQNSERIRLGMDQGIPEEEIPLIEAEPKFEEYWYVKFLTPFGHVLYEGETPYAHEEHPYAGILYPLLDGEVWGFVEDIIDQQRYINRLIILMDFIIAASAKGVLMIPEDVIPEHMSEKDFANEWRAFNGTIVYTPKPHGQVPQQISANSTQIGINEMLALQMQLLQEVSGVRGAIQGEKAASGTPASLYAQEAQNATMNTLDYMMSFQNFIRKRDTKALKVITQFYKEKRYLAINGRSVSEDSRIYDPERVKNLAWDVVVAQGTDTPVYRQIIDETLMKLLEGQLIDLKMFLEHTSLPFADKLLASVKAQEEQMMNQGGAPGQVQLPPELLAQAGQADPKAMELAQRALGRGPQG